MSILKDIGLVIKNVICAVNTAYVISYEGLKYCFTGDFDTFTRNIAKKLSGLNILYVKLFQAFANNNNLISENTNRIFLEYSTITEWKIQKILKMPCCSATENTNSMREAVCAAQTHVMHRNQ